MLAQNRFEFDRNWREKGGGGRKSADPERPSLRQSGRKLKWPEVALLKFYFLVQEKCVEVESVFSWAKKGKEQKRRERRKRHEAKGVCVIPSDGQKHFFRDLATKTLGQSPRSCPFGCPTWSERSGVTDEQQGHR